MYSFRYSILLAVLFALVKNTCYSQSQDNINPNETDSITYQLQKLRANADYDLYYDTLIDYTTHLAKKEDPSYYNQFELWYDWLPESKEDSTIYRKALMFYGHRMKKYYNDYYGSKDYLELAHQYANDKYLLDKWAWYTEKHLASIYARLNEYDKAIYCYRKLLPGMEHRQEWRNLSRLYDDLATAYGLNDEPERSEYFFEKAFNLGQDQREARTIFSVALKLAQLRSEARDTSEFNKYFNIALEYYDSIAPYSSCAEHIAHLHEVAGHHYLRIMKPEMALSQYKTALPFIRDYYTSRRSREQAKSIQNISHAFLELDILDSAEVWIARGFKKLCPDCTFKGLPHVDQIEFENTFIDLLDLKSKILFARYEQSGQVEFLDSAISAIDLALFANDQLEEELLLSNSKLESLATSKKLLESGLNYCYVGHSKIKNHKYLEMALLYFNRSKGRLLRSSRWRNFYISNLGQTEKNDILNYAKSLSDLKRNKYQTPEKSDSLESVILEVQSKINQILPDSILRLQQGKRLSEPHIEYVVTQNEIFLLSNINGSHFLKISSKDSISAMIRSVQKKINSRGNLDELQVVLVELYDLLIPINISGEEFITIVPDGELCYLPFDLLRTNGYYLLEKHTINSRFHAIQTQSNKTTNHIQKVFCWRPEYAPRPMAYLEHTERGVIVPLPFSLEETENICQTYSEQCEVTSIMKIDTLKEKMQSNDIFHFCGHAIVRNDSAYLVGQKENGQIIKVHSDELSEMPNELDLVVLSACETGLGEFKSGEGVQSLATAFLHSGSESIVYSLWSVNDQSTSVLMSEFYKQYKQESHPTKALQKSKLNYLKNAKDEKSHPYYWAGFVASTTPSIAHSDSNIYNFLFITASLLLLYIIIQSFKSYWHET